MKYQDQAKQARLKVMEMIWKAQSSHIGSNFSAIDLLTVIFSKLKKADKIVVSKGWIAASVYYFLAKRGTISESDLDTYCQPGSKYIGLTEPSVEGIEFAGGSMGIGFPGAVGFALAKKIKREDGIVYCLMSDGEQAIGTTWEAAAIARHHFLDNLVVIVDKNKFQAMGKTEDVLNMSDLRTKWSAFGWHTKEIDGHNFDQIEWALAGEHKPLVVIANTIKGRGFSEFAGDNTWHYKNIPDDVYQRAVKEING